MKKSFLKSLYCNSVNNANRVYKVFQINNLLWFILFFKNKINNWIEKKWHFQLMQLERL